MRTGRLLAVVGFALVISPYIIDWGYAFFLWYLFVPVAVVLSWFGVNRTCRPTVDPAASSFAILATGLLPMMLMGMLIRDTPTDGSLHKIPTGTPGVFLPICDIDVRSAAIHLVSSKWKGWAPPALISVAFTMWRTFRSRAEASIISTSATLITCVCAWPLAIFTTLMLASANSGVLAILYPMSMGAICTACSWIGGRPFGGIGILRRVVAVILPALVLGAMVFATSPDKHLCSYYDDWTPEHTWWLLHSPYVGAVLILLAVAMFLSSDPSRAEQPQ